MIILKVLLLRFLVSLLFSSTFPLSSPLLKDAVLTSAPGVLYNNNIMITSKCYDYFVTTDLAWIFKRSILIVKLIVIGRD